MYEYLYGRIIQDNTLETRDELLKQKGGPIKDTNHSQNSKYKKQGES